MKEICQFSFNMNRIMFAFRLIVLCTVLEFAASSENCAKDTLQREYGEIIYAGLIFRHGNRVPEKFYPTDPYQNISWPFEIGQLVNEGKRRAYQLGKFFRPRYGHLVGKSYTPSKVITHASSYDRTLMSGILFNAGFFPPSKNEIWNQKLGLLWQPVPIFTSPKIYDNVLRLTKPCKRLDQLRNNFYENGEMMNKICTVYEDTYAYLEEYSGFNLTPCNSYQSLYNVVLTQDTLQVESEQNLTLPEWTKKVYPHPLQFFRDNLFFVEGDDPGLKRLMAGPLFNVLASDMLNIAGKRNTLPKNIYTLEPSETRRLHLFAGHDYNIILPMRAMGVFDNKAPNYSAALGFELRKTAGQYYVTIIYENSLEEPPQLVSIPDCNGICTLEQFISFVTPLIPEDFDAECQRDLTSSFPAGAPSY